MAEYPGNPKKGLPDRPESKQRRDCQYGSWMHKGKPKQQLALDDKPSGRRQTVFARVARSPAFLAKSIVTFEHSYSFGGIYI